MVRWRDSVTRNAQVDHGLAGVVIQRVGVTFCEVEGMQLWMGRNLPG